MMTDEALTHPRTPPSPPSEDNGQADPSRSDEGGPWALQGQLDAVRQASAHMACLQDLRLLRARLDQAEAARRQAEASAARTPALQEMLKDAEEALDQRREALIVQAERLDAAERRATAATLLAEERSTAFLALSERMRHNDHALAEAEAGRHALLQEREAILTSTSWRLTTAPRRALSRLRRR